MDNDNKVEQYDSNNTATFAETVSARHQRRGQLDQYEPVDDLHSTAPSDYEHKAEGLDAAPSAATPHRHSGLRPIGRRMSVTTPPLSRERCLCDTIGMAELNQNELVGNLTLEWSQGRPSLSIATRTPRGRWCSMVRARHSQQRCLSDINDAARKGSKPKADAQVKLGIPEQSTDNGILIKSATLSSAPRPHRVHTKAKNPRQRVRRQTLTKVTWRQPLTKGKARQVSSLYTSTKPKNL